jgi:sodium-dependent dicarboxylate transporter 2/3/5
MTDAVTHTEHAGDPADGDRFDRIRQSVGIVLGPILLVTLLLIPMDLDWHQQSLLALMVFVFVMWISEALPIPVSSFLALALAVILQVPVLEPGGSASGFVYEAFSSSTLFLVIGGFILAQAMMVHGLDRRFALAVLSIPGVARSTTTVAIAFGAVAALVSAFVSNSAAAAMLLPLGLGIVSAIGPEITAVTGHHVSRSRFACVTMLMIAYGASVGGLLTPIGSTANVVGLGFLKEQVGIEIGFFEWTARTAPLSIPLFIAMCVVLLIMNRPEVGRLHGAAGYVREERSTLGPLSGGEINTLIAFLIAVVLWVAPSFAGDDAAPGTALYAFQTLDIGTAALLGAAVLFFLPLDWSKRRFTLNWREASDIDWGTVLLVGAGLVLGSLMSNTGLAETIGTSVVDLLGFHSVVPVVIASVAISIFISEATSNTAAVGVVVPVVIPIAVAAGIDPTLPAVAAVFGASMGFMMPVSTPPNAIVYGSGMVPIFRMFRTGLVFDIIAVAVISAGVLAVAAINPLS